MRRWKPLVGRRRPLFGASCAPFGASLVCALRRTWLGRGLFVRTKPSFLAYRLGEGGGGENRQAEACTNPETEAEPQRIVAQGLLSRLQYLVS